MSSTQTTHTARKAPWLHPLAIFLLLMTCASLLAMLLADAIARIMRR